MLGTRTFASKKRICIVARATAPGCLAVSRMWGFARAPHLASPAGKQYDLLPGQYVKSMRYASADERVRMVAPVGCRGVAGNSRARADD